MKTRFARFTLTMLVGLTLAPAMAPIAGAIIDRIISREAILHGSAVIGLLSLLMLALLLGTLATWLTNAAWGMFDGKPRINPES